MGEKYVSIMDNYFDVLKERMNNRFRIPRKLVEDYKDDVCFMVDSARVYIQAMKPRIVWVKPLPYEVNIDETKDIIEELINDPVDPKAKYFGTYDEEKARIELEIKLPQAINKGKKRIAKMKTSTPLLLTKGKGEDEEKQRAQMRNVQKQKVAEELKKQMEEKEEQKERGNGIFP